LNRSKVLVVDDTVEHISLVAKYLKDEGYSVVMAKDGKKALELIKSQMIDLILLDVNMPVMDGYEVATHLKNPNKELQYSEYEPYKNIPIIFLTANSNPEEITKGFEIGGQDYITKPFNKAELIARVSTHLKLAKALSTNLILLDQYKQVVDESTIVSKTDLKGKITYVNKSFLEISGYKEEELLGKPHNIIRDPKMPKEAFKDLWETIQEKQVWKGEVSNLKKNGEHYIVQSTVMPIVDDHGEVQEYISVRHDVTELHTLQKEIEDTQKEVIFTMGAIGETRSKETGNHVKRVAEYSRVLAKYSGMDEKQIEMLVQASPMHDIGKVAIPDNILQKPTKLDEAEFKTMQTHAELGYKMLAHSTRPLLKLAATVAYEHHERWDGKGYPRKLKEQEISLEGRITAIADVFDALGSDRCYKKAWSDEKIFTLFRQERGKQFDPNLIDIFFEHYDEISIIKEQFKDV
jgi:PAS domain S-box-containing protein